MHTTNYKTIAGIIKQNTLQDGFGVQPGKYIDKGQLMLDLAEYFKKDNPEFNQQKFFAACRQKDNIYHCSVT